MTFSGYPTATARLLSLLTPSPSFPLPLDVVRQCVMEGANVMEMVPHDIDGENMPFLSFVISRGEKAAALACLRSSSPIDFTVTDQSGRTALHAAALANTSEGDSYNWTLIQSIVHRLEVEPRDVVSWGKKQTLGAPLDFIAAAAFNQILHVVWRVVQSVPYFADQVDRIPLTEEVWKWDWNALTEEEQEHFTLRSVKRLHVVERSTAQLWKAVTRYPHPDLKGVQKCVREGADVLYGAAKYHRPILTYAIWKNKIEVVELLLQSPAPLNFAVGDVNGNTPIHYIPFDKPAADVRRLLYLVLDRLESPSSAVDRIHWGEREVLGNCPISYAAFTGHLATWLEVVLHERPVKFYTEHQGKIEVTHLVMRSDWNRITPSAQAKLELSKGIDESC